MTEDLTEEELATRIRNHTVAGNVAVANGLILRSYQEWRIADSYQRRLEALQSDGRGGSAHRGSSGHSER